MEADNLPTPSATPSTHASRKAARAARAAVARDRHLTNRRIALAAAAGPNVAPAKIIDRAEILLAWLEALPVPNGGSADE